MHLPPRLPCLQVTDHGLACLHSLGQLRALNLAGVRVR